MAEEREVVILVIEDSPTSTELVKFWIEDGLPMRCRVETAATLADGLQVLESHQVDVIILDLNLPDSLGLETFLKLQRFSGQIAIVVMTSVDNEEIALSAVRQGAQDYIVKESFENNPLARPVSFAIERIARQRAERARQQTEEQRRRHWR